MNGFPQISIKHNIGNIIEIPNELNVSVFTYLADNYPIGTTAIDVDNANDFVGGNTLLLLGSIGAENAEFGFATGKTNQSFTTVATKQPHSRGDLVSQLNYDGVEISKASTIDGSYSVLATLPLFVTQQKTVQFDASGLVTDFYKLRWTNSVSGDASAYSNPVSVLSYPINSVGSIIDPVLVSMGVSPNDPKITTAFCISALNDAREYVRSQLYGIRHAWLFNAEFPIKVLAGSNFVWLPDDIDFIETDRSLLAARFINSNVMAPFNLAYRDKRSWNQIAFNVSGSETVGETAIGATEIQLESSGDFPFASSGSNNAIVATTDYDQVTLSIEYTDVDLINNKLLGVTGIDRILPEGTQIWVTPTINQPVTYTVYSEGDEQDSRGKIVFDGIVPDSMQGNNLYIDYYKRFLLVEDLYQRLPEPYREIYKWYLKYAIKYRKDITVAQSDPDYVKFDNEVKALFNNLYTGQDTIIVTT